MNHSNNHKSCLIVLVKNKVKGRVKRRLARSIGAENALLLYQHLMEKIHSEVKDIPVSKFLYYSDYIENWDIWDNGFFEKKVQVDGDLGIRMSQSFQECFKAGFDRVVLIGSDIIRLNKIIILDAFNYLQQADIVLGPAFDGGYYLIGMNQNFEFLFQDKPWGTSTVLVRTLRDCVENDLICKLTPELSDMDTFSDLKYLEPEDKLRFANLIGQPNKIKQISQGK